jgi:hypothetical protein
MTEYFPTPFIPVLVNAAMPALYQQDPATTLADISES